MIWFLCSKLPSAVLLRGIKIQEGDFGDETYTNSVRWSIPWQWAGTHVLANCYHVPWPKLVWPSQHFSQQDVGMVCH